ncbi:unnamed protein product [Durusdinium trenchii]|uniref:Uncharacterized protein n=1 Tax=Durusdinium trenchii TaxID=1381693 RepID=A0ABP0QIY7_9DINO
MESQGTRRRGGVPQRVTWSQFKASKSAAAKAEIEGRWELLIADGEAKNLLSMRQRLGPSTDPGLVHLREEIDKMISERAELLEKGSTGSVATSQAAAFSFTASLCTAAAVGAGQCTSSITIPDLPRPLLGQGCS